MKNNRKYQNEWKRKDYRINPWKYTLKRIKQRCNNLNCKDYKNYGGRGIKCKITSEEIRYLWFRDKAYNMKKSTIDRINNNGHYILENCEFIENSKNARKNKFIKIAQYNLKKTLLRIWPSQQEIVKTLNLCQPCLSACINGTQKTSGGFIWKRI